MRGGGIIVQTDSSRADEKHLSLSLDGIPGQWIRRPKHTSEDFVDKHNQAEKRRTHVENGRPGIASYGERDGHDLCPSRFAEELARSDLEIRSEPSGRDAPGQPECV